MIITSDTYRSHLDERKRVVFVSLNTDLRYTFAMRHYVDGLAQDWKTRLYYN